MCPHLSFVPGKLRPVVIILFFPTMFFFCFLHLLCFYDICGCLVCIFIMKWYFKYYFIFFEITLIIFMVFSSS